MVFLSPLYSLFYKILDWGLNRVIGTLSVTSTAGEDVFSLSFFCTFVTLNVWDFLLQKGKKNKAANQHTHTIQTD